MKLTSIHASIQLGLKNIPTSSTAYQKMRPSASFASCLVVVQAWRKQTVCGSRKVFGHGTSSKVVVRKSKGNSQLISRPKPTKVHFFLMFTSPKPPDTLTSCWIKQSGPLSSKKRKDLKQNRRVIEILLDITKTLGRQGIAFRGHGSDDDGNFKQIVQLVAKYCPELRHWLNTTRMRPYHVTYLSAQSQNEFIELIGWEVQQCIVQEIKDAGMYSVMADTTLDVSHKDRLAIACWYVDKMGQPRERLVSLTEAKDKTGDGGATEIIESLTEQGLDLDELCFQSYDYTASMSGRFNGVKKKLQDKLGKSVPYIPCLAHRSNTVIEHSCKASPIVAELFNVLEALFVFFTGSTKRNTSLQESIQSMEVDNPLNLRNLSRTRWTARAESIKSVWNSYEAILDSLSNLERSDDSSAASGLRVKLLR